MEPNQTTTLAPPPPLDVCGNALFLDLDGTLVDFAAHPEQVLASKELQQLLTSLSGRMNGAIALITGRTIASADQVLDGALVHVAGIHGVERRTGKAIERTSNDTAPIQAALGDTRALIAKCALQVDVEDKGLALALHYRRMPEFADATRRAAADIAQRHGLSILEGKMVIELTLGQRTKADAVTDFMAIPPFANRNPIAMGDDITDEDAFRAVAKLGGHSILVGAPRDTAARYCLPNTRAVFMWLKAGLES
ncbi:MAG: trehalose-phosphatase [Alphaproteobacteria bacterium]|nr:trehalose-phosphatase [Alphaproteobacteria bacterium]